MNEFFDLFEPLYYCFLISGIAGLWILVFSLITEFTRVNGCSRDILGIGMMLFIISISVIAIGTHLGYKPSLTGFIITASATSAISIVTGILMIRPNHKENEEKNDRT